MPRTAQAIQPATSLTVARLTGQLARTSKKMPRYWAASNPRLQRQLRLSSEPVEAAPARIRAVQSRIGFMA
jgi:hypothetical protein